MSETLGTSETLPDPITAQEAMDVAALLDQAVSLRHNGMTAEQSYDHLAGVITHTVYQTEVYNTFPGTHDLFLAARVGLFDPTIDDPKKALDPLKATGRVSKETLDGIQTSIDGRATIRSGGASDDEMAIYDTTEASKLLGMINGASGSTSREMAVAYAYVGGLYAAHGDDPRNANKVAEVNGLIQQQAAPNIEQPS